MDRKKTFLLLVFLFTFSLGLVLIFKGISSIGSRIEAPLVTQSPIATPNQTLESTPSSETQNVSGVNSEEVFVEKVIDGDTIEVIIGGDSFRVRYIGIDTPETVDPNRPIGCFGKQASDANKKIVEGKIAFLEKDITDKDRYGRLLRYVYVLDEHGNAIFVNNYLIKEGFAQVSTYPPDVKHLDTFINSQREAQSQNKGLWKAC